MNTPQIGTGAQTFRAPTSLRGLRPPGPADRLAPAASRAPAGTSLVRSEDAPSVLRSQLETQTRFATFVQATGGAANLVNKSFNGTNVAGTGGTPAADPADTKSGLDALLSRLPDDVRAEVDRFVNGDIEADYYTPENTADRIATFALGGFERFEGGAAAQENTSAARQRYVDFILPAIDKGYGEALSQLGDLPDEILSGLERTRTLIGEHLDAFAAQEPVEVDA